MIRPMQHRRRPQHPLQSAADSAAPANATVNAAAAPSDPAQQLQSMARDLANANQEVETLKAGIAELKAGQQQMARDLGKVSDRLAEQNAKAKVAATQHAAARAQTRVTLFTDTSFVCAAARLPAVLFRAGRGNSGLSLCRRATLRATAADVAAAAG